MSFESTIFSPAYLSARATGMATGYIISGLVICPAILADWLYQHLSQSFQLSNHPSHEECDVRVYDLPHLFSYEEIKSLPIYHGGFFSASKPLKIVAELIGSLTNAIVAASTFILIGILEIALITVAIPFVLMLGVAAAFAGGIYCLAQSYQKGFQKQCIDTINQLSENLL